jgi:hypothetical protein
VAGMGRVEGPGNAGFLETRRLVLRRFTVADADDLESLDADLEVMRFVAGGVPTSRAEIEVLLTRE